MNTIIAGNGSNSLEEGNLEVGEPDRYWLGSTRRNEREKVYSKVSWDNNTRSVFGPAEAVVVLASRVAVSTRAKDARAREQRRRECEGVEDRKRIYPDQPVLLDRVHRRRMECLGSFEVAQVSFHFFRPPEMLEKSVLAQQGRWIAVLNVDQLVGECRCS